MLAIRTENLTKKYKEVTALKNLNLAVIKGDVFGLLEPNGAGQTTTLKILMGYLNPTSGRITVFYRPLFSQMLKRSATGSEF